MKPHKHDWHCGFITNEFIDGKLTGIKISVWACSLCGAIKELKSKEVVK